MGTRAYPLQWPKGQARTKKPVRSRFKAKFSCARDDLMHELKRLGVKLPVLSSNVELRRDGLPYPKKPHRSEIHVYYHNDGELGEPTPAPKLKL